MFEENEEKYCNSLKIELSLKVLSEKTSNKS